MISQWDAPAIRQISFGGKQFSAIRRFCLFFARCWARILQELKEVYLMFAVKASRQVITMQESSVFSSPNTSGFWNQGSEGPWGNTLVYLPLRGRSGSEALPTRASRKIVRIRGLMWTPASPDVKPLRVGGNSQVSIKIVVGVISSKIRIWTCP